MSKKIKAGALGQGLAEYAIIGCLVLVACIVSLSSMGDAFNSTLVNLKADLMSQSGGASGGASGSTGIGGGALGGDAGGSGLTVPPNADGQLVQNPNGDSYNQPAPATANDGIGLEKITTYGNNDSYGDLNEGDW